MCEQRKQEFTIVGRSEQKVDGIALVTGKPKFVTDIDLSNMLYVKILHSPYAHARIAEINTSRAEALPGVMCVLSSKNTPSTRYTTAGQGYPEPSPYDTRMFDTKVRFVGDRVAAVAAETEEIALQALKEIEVHYEELSPVLSADAATMLETAIIHDEKDATGIFDPARNISAKIDINVGDVTQGFAESDSIVETTCETQYVQHTPIEPHVVLSYLDEDGRLVLRTSTQVPFHVRRIVSYVLGIPLHQIRVIKPRTGGSFGVKQEVLLEDLAG